MLDQLTEKADCCASFSYKLLKAGGLYDEISSAYSSTQSSCISPETILKVLFAAKSYEIEYWPQEINNFRHCKSVQYENPQGDEVTHQEMETSSSQYKNNCQLCSYKTITALGIFAAVGAAVILPRILSQSSL